MFGPTEGLAAFLVSLRHSSIPISARHMAKMCFLDWLGSALIGSKQHPARIIVDVLGGLGGAPESTIIGYGNRTSCMSAALINGVMSHIVELDDVHKASILHPAAPIMPAALAVAEKIKSSGQDFLVAVVAGYDAAVRIGEAVNPAHYKYWHTTGTCGTFGAAAAVGRLLGLDKRGMINALGSAGTQAAGLWEFLKDGAMSKHLHPGKAAANGLLSALLAKSGFTGATTILEGEKGFCRATSSQYDLGRITSGLGEIFKINETSFKLHASCRHTHSTIDAVVDIRKKNRIQPRQVKRIEVRTYSVASETASHEDPKSPFEAKFSLPYCVSIALIKGSAGVAEFKEELLVDPEVQTLLGKVEVVVDPELDQQHPAKWPSIVEVETIDGERYSARVEYPVGDPENPVKDDDLKIKFRSLASQALSHEKINSLIQTIEKLDEVADITTVANLLY